MKKQHIPIDKILKKIIKYQVLVDKYTNLVGLIKSNVNLKNEVEVFDYLHDNNIPIDLSYLSIGHIVDDMVKDGINSDNIEEKIVIFNKLLEVFKYIQTDIEKLSNLNTDEISTMICLQCAKNMESFEIYSKICDYMLDDLKEFNFINF